MPFHVMESPEDAHAIVEIAFICFFLLRKFSELSRQEKPTGSLRPLGPGYFRARRPLSVSLQVRHSLSPVSSARTAIGLPCGRLRHLSGGGTGLPCSVFSTRRVRFRLSPGFRVRVFPYVRGTAVRSPFGSGFSASLACWG